MLQLILETNMFLLYFQTQFRHCFHVNKHIQIDEFLSMTELRILQLQDA